MQYISFLIKNSFGKMHQVNFVGLTESRFGKVQFGESLTTFLSFMERLGADNSILLTPVEPQSTNSFFHAIDARSLFHDIVATRIF